MKEESAYSLLISDKNFRDKFFSEWLTLANEATRNGHIEIALMHMKKRKEIMDEISLFI